MNFDHLYLSVLFDEAWKDICGQFTNFVQKGAEFYDDLVDYMTSGNTLTMVLSAENAVQKLRELMGPADPEEARANCPGSLRYFTWILLFFV